MGKVIRVVAQDGDNLKSILGALLGPDHAALLDPLLKFMSLGGTPVIDSLDAQASQGSHAELMDGPLRTIFLISNLLAYSTLTADGSAFNETAREDQSAYPIVDRSRRE